MVTDYDVVDKPTAAIFIYLFVYQGFTAQVLLLRFTAQVLKVCWIPGPTAC